MHIDHKNIKYLLSLLLWIAIVSFCFLNRDSITVENIVNFASSNIYTSIPLMLCFFAIKSIVVFVYYGLLYAASGIIFPLHGAVIINIIGTFVMISIPYMIGRFSKEKIAATISQKKNNLKFLKVTEFENEFLTVFLTRLIGILPIDLVGMYFGAKGISPKNYYLGSVVGLLPTILLYTIIGMSIDDISSPAFIISVLVQVLLIISSITVSLIISKKRKRHIAHP